MRRAINFLMLVGMMLGFLLGIDSIKTAEAAPTVVLKLQVEEPAGSGNFQDAGIVRQARTSARYRLYYSISDIDGNTIENMIVKVTWPNGEGNASVGSLTNIVMPSTVKSVTTTKGTDPVININFKSPMVPGNTGTVEFTLPFYAKGPDGFIMTPTLSVAGTSVSTSTGSTAFDIDCGTGPSVEIKGTNQYFTTKKEITMEYYTSDAEAYVVEYKISASRPGGNDVGSLSGLESWKIIDQLPDLPGLIPEVLSVKELTSGESYSYNPATKIVTISGMSPYSSSDTMYVTVRYPKTQVDALGGAGLALTNKAYVEGTYAGGEYYKSPEVSATYYVKDVPPVTAAKISSSKTAWGPDGNGEVKTTSGLALEKASFPYQYSVSSTLANASGTKANHPPKQIEVIDEGLIFTRPDGTTYRPEADEAYFTALVGPNVRYSGAKSWQFYYRTTVGGTWLPIGTPGASGTLTLPTGTVGWKLVVDEPGDILTNVLVSAKTTLVQRDENSPIQYVENRTENRAIYPDNSVVSSEGSNKFEVLYDKQIVTRWEYQSAVVYTWIKPLTTGDSLAPGRQAKIDLHAYVDKTSTIETKGVFLAALLPPELSYDSSTSSSQYDITVIPNYQGSGLTLVRFDQNKEYPSGKDTGFMPSFIVNISPTAALTAYNISTYMGINSAQANNSSIVHSALTPKLLTDIYDLDGDGDTTEKMAGLTFSFLLKATNSVNMAKLTKGSYDASWKTSGSKIDPSSEFQYRLFFRNDDTKKVTNLVMIDILPRIGDVDPLTNQARGSGWRPILSAPLVPPTGGSVFYSTSSTPNMSPIVANGWSGSWQSTPPADLSTVTAIKVDFGSKQFESGEEANVYITMKAPASGTDNLSLANNTVDFYVDEVLSDGVSVQPMLPAASNSTAVTYRIPSSSIGDFIWADTNGNGIQDNDEPGLNGIAVELWNVTTGLKVADFITQNHPISNKPGYYLFDKLGDGQYKVKIPIGSGYDVTTKGAGSDPDKNSKFNTDGYTDIINLLDDTALLNIDGGYTHIYPISGTVFEDKDNDGIWNSLNDEPFASYLVTLKNSSNTVIATATTDSSGLYNFPLVFPGNYTIEVDVSAMKAVGWNETTPTPANPGNISSRSVSITNAAISGQDFGYYLQGTISGYTVWDSNLSGSYTPADLNHPIEGSCVDLVDLDQGGIIIASVVTDVDGKFVFNNVDPTGNYEIRIDNNCPVLNPLDQSYTYYNTALPISARVTPSISKSSPQVGPYIFGYRTISSDLVITKKANVQTVRVGELVPYTITIENKGSQPVTDVKIQDLTPPGFKYVSGSARLDKVKIANPTGMRPLYFEIGTINPGQKMTLTYILIAGSAVQPGEYKNVAVAKDSADSPNSNEATATVNVVSDPLFDDSLVFGKVFYDKNGDGVQQKDEPGIGGVKLVTVRGEIITTDRQGRYHIPAVSGGRWDRGTNFVLKLDIRSLPEGSKVLSENPRVKRATPGVPLRVNFAIELPSSAAEEVIKEYKVIQKEEMTEKERELEENKRISLRGVNFAFDEDAILPEFENTLDQVVEVLKKHPEWAIGIEGHTDGIGSTEYNQDLSQRRANSVKRYLISQGIPDSQLVEVKGYGKAQPIADNETPSGRYLNRRVDIVVKE